MTPLPDNEAPQSKEFTISSEQALRLTSKAQNALVSDLWFATALMIADSQDIQAFIRIIDLANKVKAEQAPQARKHYRFIYEGLKMASRILRKRSGDQRVPSSTPYRKTIRIKRDKIPEDKT